MEVLAPAGTDAAPRGRVALIVPRWTDRANSGPQELPFRSFTLGGAFLQAGFELVFFDQEHDLDRVDRWGELVAALDGADAAFVWMNELYPSNQSHNTLRIATELRRALPRLPIVAGGELVTICPPEFFDVPCGVDVFLRGNGEETALRLVEHLRAGTAPDDVPGAVWRERGGALRSVDLAPRAAFRPEFLALYDRLDLSRWIQIGGVFGNDQPTLTVATGRGCTKGCGFCAWRNHPSRVLGAEPTFELIAKLRRRYGVRQFHIAELDFFLSRQRVLALADRLRRELPDVVWFALGSPIDLRELSDDDWDLLFAGGLRKVELGSESASARMLRHIGKKHDPEDVFTVSMQMLRRGIVPMNNFLFGFPTETSADRAATLAMIERLRRVSLERNHFTYRYYQPVWNTPLGDVALSAVPNAPRRFDEWLAQRSRYADERWRTMPWLPEADEREVKRLVNHDLPLATSRLDVEPWARRGVFRALRARARRSVAAGRCGSELGLWLYRRFVGLPLDCTYVP